jgi:uncharacterized integral membrane protein
MPGPSILVVMLVVFRICSDVDLGYPTGTATMPAIVSTVVIMVLMVVVVVVVVLVMAATDLRWRQGYGELLLVKSLGRHRA